MSEQESKNRLRLQDSNTLGAPASEAEQGLRPTLSKVSSYQSTLSIPESLRQRNSRSPDSVSLLSVDDFSELRSSLTREEFDGPLETPSGWRGKVRAVWRRNLGLALVVAAQMFGTLMNVTTRMLEQNENGGMHPFQVIFARMSITTVLASLYMWYTKTEHFPLGAKEVRWILVARGLGGFFGVFGLYWSLQYLALADATVITFIAPGLSCWVCSWLIHEDFTRTEQIGTVISLLGVVFIARPTAIFNHSSMPTASDPSIAAVNATAAAIHHSTPPTPSQRLAAVGMALVGVCGSSSAYVTIRWIGKRAHALISVNYFAAWCTIVSAFALLFIPDIPFVLPWTAKQWLLLFGIGISGFVMQFLLTAGLRYEKSSRAMNMVYSQMLFALLADKFIWDITPGVWSWVGSALILGNAVVVAIQKDRAASSAENDRVEGTVGKGDGSTEDLEAGLATDEEMQPLRGKNVNYGGQDSGEREEAGEESSDRRS